MVVMKLEVKESSEKRRSRQLLPTPARMEEGTETLRRKMKIGMLQGLKPRETHRYRLSARA